MYSYTKPGVQTFQPYVSDSNSKQFEFDDISNTLGMEKSALQQEDDSGKSGLVALLTSIDWRYQLWKAGVTMTENVRQPALKSCCELMIMKDIIVTANALPPLQPFLYLLWYFVFSILGNYNYFFFAAHLIDVAVGVAALRIILEAITHNGKQVRFCFNFDFDFN